jgi:hypothetical protein
MASEIIRHKTMNTAESRSEYVGALIADERRLVMVSVDPDEPWEAFRKLRRVMRRQHQGAATTAMFESTAPIEHQADVISIESRRRAG